MNACNTARGSLRPGDEMFGLIRSILFAGAKSVIAGLWKLNDKAAYFTLTKFYYNIFVEGTNKSESLAKAQLYVKNLSLGEVDKNLKDVFDPKTLQDTLEMLSKLGPKPLNPILFLVTVCIGRGLDLRHYIS
ncbi:MAG: CHAT domain-containing protein [Thermoproteota archaeon]|nr:CHAT domain-containing protein [Thermoproteota archaeon]